ncbi:hypothetical protein AJ79_09977 [Helicocarpus griseus UAMH5409]|uniref:Major facilitator superfamily (MFS) profile domain-containing protein n=1 Tax=Helicocarpus griseus UAMH5409 TaxID=1447875 RepID=A0A2B7WFY2_9EURO|nr:hypothetical protein AJ79_09977 [Helicocarpus griseus UAMH5409]
MASGPETPGTGGAPGELSNKDSQAFNEQRGLSISASVQPSSTVSPSQEKGANAAKGETDTEKKSIEQGTVSSPLGAADANNTTDLEKQPSNTSRTRNSPDGNEPPAPEAPELTGQSEDPEGNVYPEGGLQAYLVVFGSFMGLFGSLGLVNSAGTFLAWLTNHQLKESSHGSIAWIFGIYAFLMFFGGVQIGPIFDAKGPRGLVITGSIMVVLSLVLFGLCKEYWHFMIVWGVIGGLGMSLIFTPAIAAPGHWFFQLRGRATGIASTGGSLGGVVFPLMLQDIFPKIGFGWGTRAVALVTLVSVVTGCILIRSRLPKKKATKENILPDFRIFWEPQMALTTLGIFFLEWGLFIPITYISSYALAHGMPDKFSYQVLAILNVGSCFGRWIPGFVSDYIGRFNTMILTVIICFLSCACLWLPAGDSVAMLVVYALVFGFGSGSNISLTPVCVGQCCKTEHYGRYYATAYTVVSFGTLTGTPIAGSILASNGGEFWGLITFTTVCYFAGLVCFVAAKVVRHGWNLWVIY